MEDINNTLSRGYCSTIWCYSNTTELYVCGYIADKWIIHFKYKKWYKNHWTNNNKW